MSKPLALIALPLMLVCGVHDALAQDKFFTSNGVRLRFVEQGTGEAVVLLHGQGGFVEASWQETGVFGALARRYRVIALNQRGYGKSDKPHEPSAYGSYVDTPEQRRTFEERAKQAESGITGEETTEAIKRGNPGWTDAQVTEYVSRRASMNDPLAVAANYRGTPGLFISEVALSATKVPVLHVVGSLDTGLGASRQLKDKVLPSTELVVMPGANHIETLRRKEFVEAVEKFLSRHKSAP